MLTEADDFDWQNASSNYTHLPPQDDTDPEALLLEDFSKTTDPEALLLEDFIDPSAPSFGIDYAATVDQQPMTAFTALNLTPTPTPTRAAADLMSTPRKIVAPLPVVKGYTAFRELQPKVYDDKGREVKKKGRPVGWRKSVHGKGAGEQRKAESMEIENSVVSSVEPETQTSKETIPSMEPETEKVQSADPTTMHSTPTPVGYAAFRQSQAQIDGQPVKRIGRPVGWKKSIHGRTAQGLGPAKKGKGKKAQTHTKSGDEVEMVDSIMTDVLAGDVKSESEETIKVRAPENTFMSLEEMEVDSGVQPLENTFSNIKADGGDAKSETIEEPYTPARDTRMTGISQEMHPSEDDGSEGIKAEKLEDPFVSTIAEDTMSPKFWTEVLQYASMVEGSAAAPEQCEIERRDSVMEVVKESDKQEAPLNAAKQPGNGAAAKVFSIYELVERILSSLPSDDRISMKTVLQAQRVSKIFQHVISRSLKLQRLLYFRDRPPLYVRRDGRPLLRINPLFNVGNTKYFEIAETCIEFMNREAGICSVEEARDADSGACYDDLRSEGMIVLPPPHWVPTDDAIAGSSGRQSWRRMLMCQGASMGCKYTLEANFKGVNIGGDATMDQVWRAKRHDKIRPLWACGTCVECRQLGRTKRTML